MIVRLWTWGLVLTLAGIVFLGMFGEDYWPAPDDSHYATIGGQW